MPLNSFLHDVKSACHRGVPLKFNCDRRFFGQGRSRRGFLSFRSAAAFAAQGFTLDGDMLMKLCKPASLVALFGAVRQFTGLRQSARLGGHWQWIWLLQFFAGHQQRSARHVVAEFHHHSRTGNRAAAADGCAADASPSKGCCVMIGLIGCVSAKPRRTPSGIPCDRLEREFAESQP